MPNWTAFWDDRSTNSNLAILHALISILAPKTMNSKILSFASQSSRLLGFAAPRGIPKNISPFAFHFSTFEGGFRCGPHLLRNIDDALSVFHSMIKIKARASDFNKLFTILVKMNHHSYVVALFKHLHVLRFPVNQYTMNILINCFCRVKQINSGFAVVASFLKQGYNPDTVAFNSLINGLFSQGNPVEADELFRKVIRENLCKIDEFTTAIVLKGLCKSRHVDQAVQFLGDLEKVKGNVIGVYGYTNVIYGLCLSRKVDDATKLLYRMVEKGVQPSVVTYNAVIQGFCDLGRYSEADNMLKMMRDTKVHPDSQTYNAFVASFSTDGMLKDAEEMMKMMTRFGVKPDVVTYNALMEGYCLQGQLEKAKEVLNLMADKGLEPDVITYSTIINGYCKQKKMEDAEEMFIEMLSKRLEPNIIVYNTILQGLFSVGRCDDALDYYNEMGTTGFQDHYSNTIVLDGLLNNGRIQDATSFYHEAVSNKGFIVDVSFYNTFIHSLCKLEKLDSARNIFENLPSKGIYPNVQT